MRCIICKKGTEEVSLFDGIYDAEMVNVCENCAESEKIPLIRKPSVEKLNIADHSSSVRERMERMSGMRETTEISSDQTIVQGHLAKLKMPEKKEHHEDVLHDYYWTLNISRRRKKMSVGQLAEMVGVSEDLIRSIEKGKIPENFEEIFGKIELHLGIKLLKNPPSKINFIRTKDEEKEILENVRRKIEGRPSEKERKETVEMISKGELDFSKRENLQDVTLSDLVELKRKRDKVENQRKTKIRTDSMIGDDLDLDAEEL